MDLWIIDIWKVGGCLNNVLKEGPMEKDKQWCNFWTFFQRVNKMMQRPWEFRSTTGRHQLTIINVSLGILERKQLHCLPQSQNNCVKRSSLIKSSGHCGEVQLRGLYPSPLSCFTCLICGESYVY